MDIGDENEQDEDDELEVCIKAYTKILIFLFWLESTFEHNT
jgi:hypothetical protein